MIHINEPFGTSQLLDWLRFKVPDLMWEPVAPTSGLANRKYSIGEFKNTVLAWSIHRSIILCCILIWCHQHPIPVIVLSQVLLKPLICLSLLSIFTTPECYNSKI